MLHSRLLKRPRRRLPGRRRPLLGSKTQCRVPLPSSEHSMKHRPFLAKLLPKGCNINQVNSDCRRCHARLSSLPPRRCHLHPSERKDPRAAQPRPRAYDRRAGGVARWERRAERGQSWPRPGDDVPLRGVLARARANRGRGDIQGLARPRSGIHCAMSGSKQSKERFAGISWRRKMSMRPAAWKSAAPPFA